MSRPKVGSLFAGVGGFDMGLEAAGFEVAWQVEIDKDAVSVLERHYPTVRRYRDVREVNGVELPAVDVLVGGFPCQDLSVAGARKGLAGERSGLFFEVARIAAETATPWLLLENVPGLLSSFTPVEPPPRDVPPGTEWTVEETSDLGVVLSTLAEHGYGFCTRTLDAQHFGVPQRRERVFIVGCLGDTGARAAQVLLEPESVLWDLAACLEARQGAPGLPESGAGNGGVAGTLAASGAGTERPAGQGNELDFLIAGTLSSGAHPGGLNEQDAYNGHLVANTVQASAGHHGYSSPRGDGSDNLIVAAPLTAGSHPNSNMPGRHREDDVNLVAIQLAQTVAYGIDWQKEGASIREGSPTLMTERTPADSGSALSQVRRLMPIECERLMGWAPGWTERRADGALIPDGPRYRMIGNGVVKNVSEWIGRRLLAALESRP